MLELPPEMIAQPKSDSSSAPWAWEWAPEGAGDASASSAVTARTKMSGRCLGASWMAWGRGTFGTIPWTSRSPRTLKTTRSAFVYRGGNAMCRNIKTLFNFDPPATDEEIRAASLQFVRKLSGFTKPSKANEAAFFRAADQVAAVARTLIDSLVTTAPPRDREEWVARARARAAERYGRATAT